MDKVDNIVCVSTEVQQKISRKTSKFDLVATREFPLPAGAVFGSGNVSSASAAADKKSRRCVKMWLFAAGAGIHGFTGLQAVRSQAAAEGAAAVDGHMPAAGKDFGAAVFTDLRRPGVAADDDAAVRKERAVIW